MLLGGSILLYFFRQPVMNWYNRTERRHFELKVKGRCMLITYQILVELPSVHEFRGGSGFPRPFSAFTNALQFASLDLFSTLHIDCAANTNYGASLIFATTAPLAPLVLVQLFRCGDATKLKKPYKCVPVVVVVVGGAAQPPPSPFSVPRVPL